MSKLPSYINRFVICSLLETVWDLNWGVEYFLFFEQIVTSKKEGTSFCSRFSLVGEFWWHEFSRNFTFVKLTWLLRWQITATESKWGQKETAWLCFHSEVQVCISVILFSKSQFNQNENDSELSFCLYFQSKSRTVHFRGSLWQSQFNENEKDYHLSFWLCFYTRRSTVQKSPPKRRTPVPKY